MSLVNDMLRDLEQRSGRATEPLAAALPAYTPDTRHSPNIVLVGFFVLAAVTALFGLAQRTPPVATPVTAVRTAPEADDSASAPAPVPVTDTAPIATVASLHRYRLDYRLANKPAARPRAPARAATPAAVASAASAAPVAVAPARVASAHGTALSVAAAPSSVSGRTVHPATQMNTRERTHITRVDPAVQLRSDGLSALKRRRAAQAEQHFRELVALTPSNTDAHLLLHRALVAQSRLPEARGVLTHALEVSAEPARIAAVLAHALLDSGDGAAAQALLEEHRGARGADLEYVALLAAVYERNGNNEQAADRYVYLLSQRPAHGPWWIGLAITAEALGRHAESRDAFERARRSRGLDPALARYAGERLKEHGFDAMSAKEQRKRIRLGELLISEGKITDAQLRDALAYQKQTGKKLGRALTEVGAITEHELHGLLAQHLGIDYLKLGALHLDLSVVRLLPEAQARRFRALVLHRDQRGLLVGMADPTDIFAYDEIARTLGQTVRIALISENELLQTIDAIYRRTDEIAALAAEVDEQLAEGDVQLESLLQDEQSADAPIIRLLQSMFGDAVRAKASDIHIEPDEAVLRIRLRVDGVLQEQVIEGRGVSQALVTRLKLMSGLDISEKRLPQDGRFTMRVEDHGIDVRVSTMPIQHGESVVLRLLDQSASQMRLELLGMPDNIRQRFERLITHTAGMVLVTGPTGSGKTTTLYSALNAINKAGVKIITAEDPVEYRLPRINQVGINSKIGLGFSTVLRTILRQDPDIILVGEMRDEETVDIGLRAAMTGHLVFSTLHTISAPGAVHRLLDMGAPPYLIAAALHGILAQRLVRRVCEHCREPVSLSPHQRVWLEALVGLEHLGRDEFMLGSGCNLCHLTGYQGRIGVYELLELDSHLTDALRTDPMGFVKAARSSASFRPLVHCALDYARQGVTSLDEVIRVSGGLVDDVSGVTAGATRAMEQVVEPVG